MQGKNKKIKQIFFDLDGTLLDTAPQFHLALSNLIEIKGGEKVMFQDVRNLVSDGVNALVKLAFKISEKNKQYLELDNANIPTDIQVMINDGEIAMILLRLVEIIGEDNLKDLGTESLYFIISTLNKLGIDKIRDEIIIKTIPLKA